MSDHDVVESEKQSVDKAVEEGGAYELIRKRLLEQGRKLSDAAKQLNDERVKEYGGKDLTVASRLRVRTENNCVPRDIVQVGDQLLFGYNVFIGLKKETKVRDVFSLFKPNETEQGVELEEVPFEGSFLAQSSFVNDFEELYRYYKHTKLLQLTINHGKLLAEFQIGERVEDIRVFRWALKPDGKVDKYIDNRGERDIALPPPFDFTWQPLSREDIVHGKHAHLNILDTVFIDTLHGDLTIKVENNTEDGLGIYREPVEDDTQSLDDVEAEYAKLGDLILISILPYRENKRRYFIFNELNQSVSRVDAVGASCVQLPEDHGVIFPGGYCLQTGELKSFEGGADGFKFKRMIRSPNGEDVLYVFYHPINGEVALLPYNLIRKNLQNPIMGNGHALADDGKLIIFTAEPEATRVHPMQLWETPFYSDEFASKQPPSQTFYGRIGNAELVRGVSDIFSICRLIESQKASMRVYEELSQASQKFFDNHYWVDSQEAAAIATLLKEIESTAELVIDEFEKVESIRAQSDKAMKEAAQEQSVILQAIRQHSGESIDEFVNTLARLRRQKGHLATISELRYIDKSRIDELLQNLDKEEAALSERTVEFLSREDSLNQYDERVEALEVDVSKASTNAALQPLADEVDGIAKGLDLLSELMATLNVADATVRTSIIDRISFVYAKVNQARANLGHKQNNLGKKEAVAQFGAQFKLFSQSIANALSLSGTPEKCEEHLSRLLVQLEELESQFAEHDEFLTDIMAKREEVYESFESHKQKLLDNQQRKAQSVASAAERILSSISKRAMKFQSADELNTFFASDALVQKSKELIEQLRTLGNAVKADDIDAQLKASKEQAIRSLRDKTEIFEAGGNVIKLGPRHKFSVNTQELDLTIIPRDKLLNIHLSGTDYFEPIHDEALNNLRAYWEMTLESESDTVYRAEYLAYQILIAAERFQKGLSLGALAEAMLEDGKLDTIVRQFAEPLYKEGYEKGIHDHDATLLLKKLVPAIQAGDLLRFDPLSRGLAQIFWANRVKRSRESLGMSNDKIPTAHLNHETWCERAQSAVQMQTVFASSQAVELLTEEVASGLQEFIAAHPLPVTELEVRRAADYLVAEMSRDRLEFIGSQYAQRLVEELKQSLDDQTWRRYQLALERLMGWPAERWELTEAWLKALVADKGLEKLGRYIPEAVALINSDERLDRRFTEVGLDIYVENLMGDHPIINDRSLNYTLDEFLQRLEKHRHEAIPGYRQYLTIRQGIIEREKKLLKLDSFKARPLSSFVRNKLINDAYLPIIGDNLAKQMGSVGENKRTDLMGLLMMISPPGYGKTTLMEYVASRLGLVFMKVNCPALGHHVLSLDPEQAPNATARQELEKLNLGLEMGNNVMLYLDDIQHTNPEFLQKFISLCDGTRRIEGVWKGETKTYDMRGRKFCVVMAGNPYTESGEVFKIPDMLANRADIYNLGDVLSGMDEQFALSYIENSMTSNSVIAPLALRDMDDLYTLVKIARGESIPATDLKHQYSGAEVNEITGILRKLIAIQEVVLKVNQQYIASAAQSDKYRVEPSFKLQGSYRNMNKMAEKVSAVMNDAELNDLIRDHYLGEAQLLTVGAEENLLKLGELRGTLTEDEKRRWEQIKHDFLRNKSIGGDDSDTGTKVVAQLHDLVEHVSSIGRSYSESQASNAALSASQISKKQVLDLSDEALVNIAKVIKAAQSKVEVINQPVPGINQVLSALADTMEHSIFPLIRTMDKKLEIDLANHEKMTEVVTQLRGLENSVTRVAKSTAAKPGAPKQKNGPAKPAPPKRPRD